MFTRWFTQRQTARICQHQHQQAGPRRVKDAPRFRRPCMEQLEPRLPLTSLPAGFEEDLVVSGLETPTSMAIVGDGRIFVAEKEHGVRVVENGYLQPVPLVSLPVERLLEQGVHAIELDPDFAANGFVYIYYTRSDTAGSFNRLSRFTISSTNRNILNPDSERALIDRISIAAPNHNGGFLHFGADGLLYLGIGDTLDTALPQDLSKLQGKIVRINPNSYPNIIPPDNPFVNTPGARGEIWATGFRNPFTGGVMPGTNQLYVNDVGFQSFEEINYIVKGSNYGWPLEEGAAANARFTRPIHAYAHGRGAAVTGGAFYNATQFPAAYYNKYFFSDFVQGFIRTLDVATGAVVDFATAASSPVDIDFGPDGDLYWLSIYDGQISKISYVGGNRKPIPLATATPTSGLAPLTVAFDGSRSSDPDNDALTFSWSFGDGTSAEGATVQHTFAANGLYVAALTVSDGNTSVHSQPLSIIVGDQAPFGRILSPHPSLRYKSGETIAFDGMASDPEDGDLPATALEWRIIFHHDTHTHPFVSEIKGVNRGTFQIPVFGEPDPNQWYRVHLTVTDSRGLTHSSYTDVLPATTSFTLATDPPSGQVFLDGQPQTSPLATKGVVGMRRTIAVPNTRQLNGSIYFFSGWSDGGALSHVITTPQAATTYKANYQIKPLAAFYSSSPPTSLFGGQTVSYPVTVTNAGRTTWRMSGSQAVRLAIYFGGASDAPGAWAALPTYVNLTRDIAPGQSFTFTAKAPVPAAAGSYVLRHRLVQGSAWFDTLQKVNTTVQSLVATYSSIPPTTWLAGQTKTYTVTVRNTGTATWNALGPNAVRLGVYFAGASDAPGAEAAAALRVPLPRDLAPGQSATLTVVLKAPAAGGDYVLRQRLVKEGILWFSTMKRTNASVELLAAAITPYPPATWRANQVSTYYVLVRNTGSRTWNAGGANAVKLGIYFNRPADPPNAPPVALQKFSLPRDVRPGESIFVSVSVRAPGDVGTWSIYHCLIKEGLSWFPQSHKSTVTVRA